MFKPQSSLSILASLALLSGCAGEYTFNSNLDSQAIDEYFKPGEVTLFDKGVQPRQSYEILGLVQGQACQQTVNDAPADKAQARTEARRNAADMGANGLLIQNCHVIDEPDSSCQSQALCVGKAIKLQNNN
ncbi:hypothetical protein G3R49_11150 [Shewanella sp. WXL01]|uniref:Rcs stress response system protein RcsF n=1 Tax=Shewanella sp. WXL01 TaxID=2709721 RepID=UPI0014382AE6|nr:Rcs stress response system protein RcsF [Shewanella sp. WXL01]NKF51112.1 hypothetical protein [Shewanella sp. WXL01]